MGMPLRGGNRHRYLFLIRNPYHPNENPYHPNENPYPTHEEKSVIVTFIEGHLQRQTTCSDDMEPTDVLNRIRKGNEHSNDADDMGSLATLFTERWDTYEGLCNITLEDITRAEAVGADILQAITPPRKHPCDNVRTLRNEAAWYLREAIEEVRAAAAYF
jgi:hypothetical protein